MARKKKQTKTESVSFYVTPEQKELITAMAERENRSISSLLVNLVLTSDAAREIDLPEPILPKPLIADEEDEG